MLFFIYGVKACSKVRAKVVICIEVLQSQAVCYSTCCKWCKFLPDMFLDSAGEEKSEGKCTVLGCTNENLNELRNLFAIITLIESINDDDRRTDKPCHRPNWLN